MIPNVGKLAGKTIFITGASRGIGKAIAEKCARDGANIIIAAKTSQPHPRLPGTIYTAAEELEKLGGHCFPCEVDIRDDSQVLRAVEAGVKKFGGIDILVNNASAISLTNTTVTEMKKVDLMIGVNIRGTYLCSKTCLPHLKESKNAQILNISPPLNMSSRWFKDHCAYTFAKYGMSMCVLGMAEELKNDSIKVNALWPRTAIYTAAMEMLGGGDGVKNQCRKPEIMSDAAYCILTNDESANTGNFYIDDEVLKGRGIVDFEGYSYVKDAQLIPDFFLDEFDHGIINVTKSKSRPADTIDQPIITPPPPSSFDGSVPTTEGSKELLKTIEGIKSLASADIVKMIGGVFLFDLKDHGPIYLDLKTGSGEVGHGSIPNGGKPDATMSMSKLDFIQMFAGSLNPTSAFMSGKLKIKGDLTLAMKLEKLLKNVKAKL